MHYIKLLFLHPIDYDGYVNEKEFLAIFESNTHQEMSRYFSQDLDSDHNGLLDLEEISLWIDPKDFVPGRHREFCLRDGIGKAFL